MGRNMGCRREEREREGGREGGREDGWSTHTHTHIPFSLVVSVPPFLLLAQPLLFSAVHNDHTDSIIACIACSFDLKHNF